MALPQQKKTHPFIFIFFFFYVMLKYQLVCVEVRNLKCILLFGPGVVPSTDPTSACPLQCQREEPATLSEKVPGVV